jgi:hypothetical protein
MALQSSMPSSMFTSRILAPLRLVERDLYRLRVVVLQDQAGEALQARDVGALADHREVPVLAQRVVWAR